MQSGFPCACALIKGVDFLSVPTQAASTSPYFSFSRSIYCHCSLPLSCWSGREFYGFCLPWYLGLCRAPTDTQDICQANALMALRSTMLQNCTVGSAVRSEYCTSAGPKFESQQPGHVTITTCKFGSRNLIFHVHIPNPLTYTHT